ncbi:universal stress protein [Roseovarius sp. A46]|uniref:universal stress protein n=1 Tax=Roseovarius sp. A46 TaxID=2109331 RepID=UPI0010101C0F
MTPLVRSVRLIFLASHGDGLLGLLLGSTATQVVRHAEGIVAMLCWRRAGLLAVVLPFARYLPRHFREWLQLHDTGPARSKKRASAQLARVEAVEAVQAAPFEQVRFNTGKTSWVSMTISNDSATSTGAC